MLVGLVILVLISNAHLEQLCKIDVMTRVWAAYHPGTAKMVAYLNDRMLV